MTAQAITVPDFAAGRAKHGFFTRRGGVSRGIFASLNCGYGSGDDREAVAENRSRAAATLGPADLPLLTCRQIHGTEAVVVGGADGTEPWAPGDAPRADAMATRKAGIALGVLTADCAPVLLADPGAGVVGAAHAGWRGARLGVLEAAVAATERLGAKRAAISAAVGPCIAQTSYEVGASFPALFTDHDPAARRFFCSGRRNRHWQFDLAGYVASRLENLGLKKVTSLTRDTYAEDRAFFSYRRACHRGESAYGRCLSAIVLVE